MKISFKGKLKNLWSTGSGLGIIVSIAVTIGVSSLWSLITVFFRTILKTISVADRDLKILDTHDLFFLRFEVVAFAVCCSSIAILSNAIGARSLYKVHKTILGAFSGSLFVLTVYYVRDFRVKSNFELVRQEYVATDSIERIKRNSKNIEDCILAKADDNPDITRKLNIGDPFYGGVVFDKSGDGRHFCVFYRIEVLQDNTMFVSFSFDDLLKIIERQKYNPVKMPFAGAWRLATIRDMELIYSRLAHNEGFVSYDDKYCYVTRERDRDIPDLFFDLNSGNKVPVKASGHALAVYDFERR